MKKIIFILSVCLLVCFGCEQSIKTYSGKSTIYIDGQSMNDTVSVSFAYKAETDTEHSYTFRLNTIGAPTDYDRKILIEKIDEYDASSQAVEGVDYVSMHFGEYVIPAGKSFLDVNIVFKRNPILLQGVIRKLSFKLVETPDFAFHYNRSVEARRFVSNGETIDTIVYRRYIDTHRTIKLTEEIKRQSWWSASATGHPSLGKWSVKKSLLICEVLNLDRLKWLSNDQVGITTSPYLTYVGRAMHLWLLDNPTLEDDGTSMAMHKSVSY